MLKFFLKSCAVILLSLSLAQCSWAGVSLDGTDGNINHGDRTDLEWTLDITVSLWVEFISLPDAWDGLFNKRSGALNGDWGFNYRAGATDKFQWFFRGGDSYEIATAGLAATFSTGVKYNIICTGDSDGTNTDLEVFKDNVSVATHTATNNTPAANVEDFIIGMSEDESGHANAIITEVAKWDVVLNAAERELLAKSGIKGIPLQIRPANLQAYFPLDDHPAGVSINTLVFKDMVGANDGTGSDAGGESVTVGESTLSYPSPILGGL